MLSLTTVLIATIPVFVIGVIFVELLLRAAPRRGKRPDVGGYTPETQAGVRVIAPNGKELVGTPLEVARALAKLGFPKTHSADEAAKLLAVWQQLGRIEVFPHW
jgi:hypothetical protein